MKKIVFTSLLLLYFFNLKSQNIDNPSFDSVYIGGIDRIHSWITSDTWALSSNDTVHPLNPLTHYQSVGLQFHEALFTVQIEYASAFDGALSAKVLCDTGRVDIFENPFRGFVLNGNDFYTDANGYLDLKKGGTPFPYRPYKLRGHYKMEDNSVSLHNYPQAVVLLKKYNTITQQSDTIGFADASIQLFQTTSWREFDMPINYVSNQIPDSIVVAFFSPALGHNSTFWIDSLGFDFNFPTGITENLLVESQFFFINNNENKLFFQTENFNSVSIFNLSGQLVISATERLPFIDIAKLSAGTYFISIEMFDRTTRKSKFIRN